jgi:hypothetical protein
VLWKIVEVRYKAIIDEPKTLKLTIIHAFPRIDAKIISNTKKAMDIKTPNAWLILLNNSSALTSFFDFGIIQLL